MTKYKGKHFATSKRSVEEVDDKYPLLIRIYGVLCVLGGAVQVASFVLALLAVFFGKLDLSKIEEHVLVTVIIGAVALLISVVLAVLFVVLGVRLLKGSRKRVALAANVMIALETLNLVCVFMLVGLSHELIPPFVNMVILVALQAYSDPSLRQERALQRRLQEMEWRSEAEKGTLGRDLTGKGYIQLNFFNVFWVFVICCFLGDIIETIWHMVIVDPGVFQNRAGLLYGPFSPIYGFGAVLMTTALNRFHDRNPILIFLVSAVIGGAFEYFVSWFMQTAFGITAWDYTGTFLSINGRTNGMFMCIWGILGFVWVRFALPVMLKVVNKIPWNWRYGVTTVCTALMLANGVLTLASLDCWYQRQAGTMDHDNPSFIVQFCNENYDDEFMTNRFQSMTMDTSSVSRAK